MIRLKPQEIAEKLKPFCTELEKIATELDNPSSKHAYLEKNKLQSWWNRIKGFLKEVGLPQEAFEIGHIILEGWPFSDYLSFIEPPHLKGKLIAALPKLETIINEIASYREDYLPSSGESPDPFALEDAKKDNLKNRFGDKVFIVHGHDKTNLYVLRDLLEKRYELECTVMMWKPGKGRTLIEKFEQEAQEAGFAFIIMTPDDLVEFPLATGKKGQYAQARPNVIFELGWFHGRLGRNRVCILFKKGTKIHSDLDGISRIEFSESVTEKVPEIENELRAAGLIS